MAEAVIQVSWDYGPIGKGAMLLRCWTTGTAQVFFVYRNESETFFEYRSGDLPKGLLFPKKGRIKGLPDTGYSCNVRLEPENPNEAMLLVNRWYHMHSGPGTKPGDPPVMYERYFPEGGGGVAGYPIAITRFA